MKHSFSSNDFLWLGLSLLVPLTLFIIFPITPNDYWWYVRLGGEIAETYAVPIVDTYSFTLGGQPIVYHSWLSSLLFFWLNYIGGSTATIFFSALVVGLAYMILWFMMREMRVSPLLSFGLILFSVLPGSMNFVMRPQLFAYPLFTASFWLLWRWQTKTEKKIWLLPFLALLWVNLHGSFVLVFLLIGAALVFGRGDRKLLLTVFIAVFISTLLNPRFLHVWNYLVDSLTLPGQAFSREWKPPFNEGWQMNIFFLWILFFTAVVGFSSRSLSMLEWVWVLGFGWLALSGLRYGIWYLFILTPMSSYLISSGYIPKKDSGIKAVNIALGIFLFIIPLAFLPSIRSGWWQDAPSGISSDTPLAAVEWLDAHPNLPDPIWADLEFESYLIYSLPERPVWIDTRFFPFSAEHWERYIAVNSARWNWQVLLNEDNIDVLMLSQLRQVSLIQAVEESSIWDECYRDDVAIIYMRENCP